MSHKDKKVSEEFEIVYDARCRCGDEPLDWEWEPDNMRFICECSCFKLHKLIPTEANISVEASVDEEIEEEYNDYEE